MDKELQGVPNVQLAEGLTVVGFDPPASRNGGWGCVRFEGGKAKLLSKFTQVIDRDPADIGRMRDIYDQTRKIIEEFKPSILCIERSMGGGLQFVRGNLSEGVGVVKLCCYDLGVLVYEVSPGHLKKIIAGHGRAKKTHIKANIAAYFDLKKKGIEHECDAVAFSLCCLVDLGWTGYEVKVPYEG
jgi:crossover junction endodeoxyribonuclease RuvC